MKRQIAAMRHQHELANAIRHAPSIHPPGEDSHWPELLAADLIAAGWVRSALLREAISEAIESEVHSSGLPNAKARALGFQEGLLRARSIARRICDADVDRAEAQITALLLDRVARDNGNRTDLDVLLAEEVDGPA